MEDQNSLISFYFNLVGRRRKLQQEIKFKKEEIRNLKRELNRINSEMEGSAKGISGGRNNDRRKK